MTIGAPIDGVAGTSSGARPTRVIFVCTHNSARSIMAEALLRSKGGASFEVVSAGTQPSEVRALTLRVLREAGLPTDDLRSKSVAEFMGQRFDYVITVCDSARQECPTFPGEGERMHWGYDDPSAVQGDDDARLEAYRRVFTALSQRIDLFLAVQGGTRARLPT